MSATYCANRAEVRHYDMRCSTEGSTGVVLRDLRKVDRPGAWIFAPWAILGFPGCTQT